MEIDSFCVLFLESRSHFNLSSLTGKTMPVDFASRLKFISNAACEVCEDVQTKCGLTAYSGGSMEQRLWPPDLHSTHLFSSLI